jgi:P-type Mg2+ transporter
MIFADLRIVSAKDLYVNQSTLTGEPDAARARAATLDSCFDLSNICFMGGNVVSGYGPRSS